MKKTFLHSFQLAWIAFFFANPLSAQSSEVIVRLKNPNALEDFTKVFANDLKLEKTLIADLNLHLFNTTRSKAINEVVLTKIKQHPSVVEAFLNETVEPRATTPNDQDFSQQWALEKIGMPRVWDITTGGTTANGDKIVVAVLDSGFEPAHPDLAANLWQNPKEIPNNGLDDDNNGYLDDTNGWNFGLNSPKFIPDSHGTPVVGIIGAVGNNRIGVSGINWQIQMVLLQYKDVADIFEAYDYVINLRKKYNSSQGKEGAFIVATNASFGLSSNVICPKNSTWDAIYNMLGEQGVLTAASGKNSPIDTDTQGDTPSGCPSDYLISVITTDQSDRRWEGSAFGKISIDLGAPGEDILTILPTDRYTLFDANSAAAPHVAGAISILYSVPCKALADLAIQKPAEAAKLIRTAILDGVDAVPSLQDFTSTGGRLNVYNSMRNLETFCNPNPVVGEKLKIQNLFPNPVGNTLTINYEVPDLQKFNVRVFDALGRLKYLENVDPCCFGKTQWNLDISSWASGIYFLEIELGDQKVVRTFNIAY